MKDKHIHSLEGCLMDYAYANETDWNTFHELVEKATAYDSQAVQDAIECDRIEKYIRKQFDYLEILSHEYSNGTPFVKASIRDFRGTGTIIHEFTGRHKLEALTKALEWVEGRG